MPPTADPKAKGKGKKRDRQPDLPPAEDRRAEKRNRSPPPSSSGLSGRELAILEPSFLSADFDPLKLVSRRQMSQAGEEILKSSSHGSNWALYCKLQARTNLIAHDMFLRAPMCRHEIDGLKSELLSQGNSLKSCQAENSKLSTERDDLLAKVSALEEERSSLSAKIKEAEAANLALLNSSESEKSALKNLLDEEIRKHELFVTFAEDRVIAEHEAGFQHAVREAAFFGFNIDNFTVDKDVYEGTLIPVEEIPEEASPDAEASQVPSTPPTTFINNEVVGSQDGVDGEVDGAEGEPPSSES